MLSLIGAATSEPPMPTPFLTLIAACRPVQVGDFSIGAVIIGEREAVRCWQAGQKIAKGVRYLHYDQARRHPCEKLGVPEGGARARGIGN